MPRHRGKHFQKKGFNKRSDNRFTDRRNQQNHNSAKEYRHQNQLQETDVGITQFISKLDGYSGIIKARFSDFQVNEIDLNNQVAKITDLSIPADFAKKQTRLPPEDTLNSPLEQIPQESWDAIRSILNSTEEKVVELNATNLSKEDRILIHETVQKAFGKKIQANTITQGDEKKMLFKKYDGKNDRFKWPQDKGEYVHFLVYKECLDTLQASLKIASCIKMPPSALTYAGVKDRRAKTTQWFSIKKVEPWKLIMKTRCLRNVQIGNITFKNEPLKLGQLSGNKFRIALRNITGDDDLIEKSLQSLEQNGFINYYGLQRFGNNKEVPTFSIGVQLLLGNWKEACQIILKPTESDIPELDVSKAKKIFMETGDVNKALEQFEDGRDTCIEYLLLSGLNKGHSNDLVNALANIPRNTRLLYIHAFQSLVWNLVASKRIEKYGLTVIEGDLVLLDESPGEDTEEKQVVKAVSSDECANYTIYDIVLPLPGYNITYPENLKDCYREVLEEHGLTLEMTKQKVQTYTLSGTYRKLMGRVKNLNWKIMRYNEPNCDLIRSDLEELKGLEEPKNIEDGKYKALVLEFLLNSSSYATMVLREILKSDTSCSSHAKLNDYHVTDDRNTVKETLEPKESDDCDDKIGLLSDAQKYEEFKNIVFNNVETNSTSLKRKHEEGDETVVKTVKTDES